ncbi:hypothetical protein M8C21_030374 [Ambrosia artemisiifolia]|uniref:Uncharacterized protein n=1 Tax=Ambrosia artemisiifolia TaxID=4212 RepID=A0AAD5CP20_AMBAR|nr:hypothetical protein M8C21_030374 [Ambrosia artemisiifolia]
MLSETIWGFLERISRWGWPTISPLILHRFILSANRLSLWVRFLLRIVVNRVPVYLVTAVVFSGTTDDQDFLSSIGWFDSIPVNYLHEDVYMITDSYTASTQIWLSFMETMEPKRLLGMETGGGGGVETGETVRGDWWFHLIGASLVFRGRRGWGRCWDGGRRRMGVAPSAYPPVLASTFMFFKLKYLAT